MQTRDDSLGYHVNFRLIDGRVIAPDAATRRSMARLLLRTAADFHLLAFCVPDTHLHLLVVGSREDASELVRRVKIALKLGLGLPVPFATAYFRPVETQSHLERAIDYVLGQKQHHATRHDPTHDASNLPDLLGMRLVGRRTLDSLRTFAPRFTGPRLARHLGVERLAGDLELGDLAEAAMSAACVASLDTRTVEAREACKTAVQIALGRMSPCALSRRLGISERTVRRMRKRLPADPRLVRAVELQLRFRRALREAGGEASGPAPAPGGSAAGAAPSRAH